jgi:hypothetical protein
VAANAFSRPITLWPAQKYLQLVTEGAVAAGAAGGSSTVIGSITAVSAASSSSYACMSSFEMYAVRHIGHVVFRKTNHDTRHSAWKVWEHVRSFRMASVSLGGGVVGFVAASSTVDVSDGARSAASGGAGA